MDQRLARGPFYSGRLRCDLQELLGQIYLQGDKLGSLLSFTLI
jgi:hypothetical protein